MRLTTKSEYALLALIHIARHGTGRYVRIEDICATYEISKKYLEHLLTLLRQNRYLKTRRGAGGGYKLARPANRVSLAEVIRLMDGALAPTESVSKYFFSHTPLEKERKMIEILKELRDYVARRLESVTLADLV